MAYTISFVFKAVDKYSKIAGKIAASTKKMQLAFKKLAKETGSSSRAVLNFNKSLAATGTTAIQTQFRVQRAMKGISKSIKNTSVVASRARRQNAITGVANAEAGLLPMGALGAGMAAPLVYASKKAMDFESAFADVRKVIGFAAGSADADKWQKSILKMSTTMPMAADKITQLVAAAAQAGVATQDLEEFTKLGIQASIAFDLGADETGEYLAKIKGPYEMTNKQLSHLADQMNFLSNTQASKARDILDIVRRIGGTGASLKVPAEDLAAFASTLVHLGQSPLMVDEQLKMLMIKLSAASTLSDRAQESFAALGLGSGVQVQEAFAKNGTKTILNFLNHAKASGKGMSAHLSNILGTGGAYVGAMTLANSMKLLKQTLVDVKDHTKVNDSVLNEYKNRMNTTANSVGLLKNQFDALMVSIGTSVNRAGLGPLVKILSKITMALYHFSENNPEVVAGIVVISAAVGGLLVSLAAIGGAIFFLQPLWELLASETVVAALAGMGAALTTATVGWAVLGVVVGAWLLKHKSVQKILMALVQIISTSVVLVLKLLWSTIQLVCGALGWAADGIKNLVMAIPGMHGLLKGIVATFVQWAEALKSVNNELALLGGSPKDVLDQYNLDQSQRRYPFSLHTAPTTQFYKDVDLTTQDALRSPAGSAAAINTTGITISINDPSGAVAGVQSKNSNPKAAKPKLAGRTGTQMGGYKMFDAKYS